MNPIQYTLQTLDTLQIAKSKTPKSTSERLAAAEKFAATIDNNPMPVEYSSGLIAILEFIYYLFNGNQEKSLAAVNDNGALVLHALESAPAQWHTITDSKGATVQISHEGNTISFRKNENDEPLIFNASAERFAQELRNNIPIRPEFTPQTRTLTVLLHMYYQLCCNDPAMDEHPDANLLRKNPNFLAFADQILTKSEAIDFSDPIIANNPDLQKKIRFLTDAVTEELQKRHSHCLRHNESIEEFNHTTLPLIQKHSAFLTQRTSLVMQDMVNSIADLDRHTAVKHLSEPDEHLRAPDRHPYDPEQLSRALSGWPSAQTLNEICLEVDNPTGRLPKPLADQLRPVLGGLDLPHDLDDAALKSYLALYLQTRKLSLDLESSELTADTFKRFNELGRQISSWQDAHDNAASGLSAQFTLCENTIRNGVLEIITDVTEKLPTEASIYSAPITKNMPSWLRPYDQLPELIDASVEDNVKSIVDILVKKIDASIRNFERDRSAKAGEASELLGALLDDPTPTSITVDEVRENIMPFIPKGLPRYDKLDELIEERLQIYALLQTPSEDNQDLELP